MRNVLKILIPAAMTVLAGCVVVPPRAHLVHPRVVAVKVTPAPVMIVQPRYYYRYRW